MFHLSGAINVLLFLIIRPELLLFPRPYELARPEMELAPQPPQSTSLAIVSDVANLQHSPKPTSAALGVEGSGVSATSSNVKSKEILDDI